MEFYSGLAKPLRPTEIQVVDEIRCLSMYVKHFFKLRFRHLGQQDYGRPVTVTGESFSPGKPQLWSPGQFTERFGAMNFDMHRDGKRAVVLKVPPQEEGSTTSKLTFVFNFFDELRRRVPSGK